MKDLRIDWQRRELCRSLYQSRGQFPDEDRSGFEVNAFMFKTHEQGPEWRIHSDGSMPALKLAVILDKVGDQGINLLPILPARVQIRPIHLVFGKVIPAHFIDTGFKNLFEI